MWGIFQVCFVDLQGSGRCFVGCANGYFHREKVSLKVILMGELALGCVMHMVAH